MYQARAAQLEENYEPFLDRQWLPFENAARPDRRSAGL